MTRRPAVTLIEVLVSMFIMAIGMLALLTLFPLGAITMGQALKDDRAASSAAMAEAVAIAQDIRHDSTVIIQFNGMGFPATYNGPSSPVYVDPYGALANLPSLGGPAPAVPVINRTNLYFSVNTGGNTVINQFQVDRWFSLPDDISFLQNGSPDPSGGILPRGRDYTWAYMLRRPQAQSDRLVEMSVVVYRKRPVDGTGETLYQAVGQAGGNSVTLPGVPATVAKRGSWILDITSAPTPNINAPNPYVPSYTPAPGTPPVVQGYFYRVVNVTPTGGNVVLEVQPNLKADVMTPNPPNPPNPGFIVVMDTVVEVFDKGTSWQP